jgi:hypothetical protein
VNCRYSISVAVILLGLGHAVAQAQNNDAQIVKDFESRVSSYVDLEQKQAGSPKQTASPDRLAEQRNQLAEKMRSARPQAKKGDIFTVEISQYFRRQIAATLFGPEGAKIRASLRHAEPIQQIPLQVNARYPQKVPLQSTPPTLLLNLPRLPDKLQYRIVGNALLLYDPSADLIVDWVDGVTKLTADEH